MVNKNRVFIKKLTISACCFALAMLLPTVTGSIPEVGKLLCPMHIPVFLAGALAGPLYALCVGLFAPIVRSLTMGTPPLFPEAVSMMPELAVYGVAFAFLLKLFPKKRIYCYPSLITAMLLGRIAGGISKALLATLGMISDFGMTAFLTAYFVKTLPGAIIQLILIPPILFAVQSANRKRGEVSYEA